MVGTFSQNCLTNIIKKNDFDETANNTLSI